MARSSRFGAKYLRERSNLLLRELHRAGSVDFIGRVFEFFFIGKLQRDTMTRFLFAKAACPEPFDLIFGRAVNDDQAVEPFVHSRFDQKSGFDKNWLGNALRMPFFKLHVHGGFDARMQNGIEFRKLGAIAKNDGAKSFAIDGIAIAKNSTAELVNDVVVRGPARFNELVAEQVRVENVKAEFAQLIGDPTFSAGDSSGEAKFQHKSAT